SLDFVTLYTDAARRDVPSFPTRRSSDLGRSAGRNRLGAGGGREFQYGRGHAGEFAGQHSGRSKLHVSDGARDVVPSGRGGEHNRAEEQTSELQSGRDYVCSHLHGKNDGY